MPKIRGLRDFVEPLVAIPYGFWGIYWYENGFDVVVAVLAIALFLIIPAILITFSKKL